MLGSKERKSFRIIKDIFDYIVDVLVDAVIIIFIVVLIRNFIISPFQVNGNSMTDTLYNNDYIFIEKFTYKFKDPKFLDVIIFEPPVPRIRQLTGLQCFVSHLNNFTLSSTACKAPDLYIKRVIGVPGDTISIKDGVVYRNGDIIDESMYLNSNNNNQTFLPKWQSQNEFIVPDYSVFTLGDNRNGSSDSRYWKQPSGENSPFVSFDKVEGKYFFRLLSPNKLFN